MKSLNRKRFVLVVVSAFFAYAGLAQINAQTLSSPVILNDNYVTFNLFAPEASDVKLKGEWMANFNSGEKMIKGNDGIWTYTTKQPLKEDLYSYSFQVNGVKVLDPLNFQKLGNKNVLNYFIVSGETSDLYKMNDVPHGTVSNVWYDSPVLGMKRRMKIYTPPGYESNNKKYPVLYLLHGVGGDEEDWMSVGAAVNILDNLIAQGKAKPMIMVMTNGNYYQSSSFDDANSPGGNLRVDIYNNAGKFEESIIKDIIPFVDNNYKTISKSESRAIAGLSMGGGQATYTAFTYSDYYDWVGSFSGAFVVWPQVRPAPDIDDVDVEAIGNNVFPQLDSSVNSEFELIYLTIGTKDPLLDSQLKVRNWLKQKGIHFDDIQTEGYAHVWSYWRLNLIDFTSKIFK